MWVLLTRIVTLLVLDFLLNNEDLNNFNCRFATQWYAYAWQKTTLIILK
jgi:hypothetical protein